MSYGASDVPPVLTYFGEGSRPMGVRPLERQYSKTSSKKECREYSLFAKCMAEFVGDLTFVFCGTMQANVAPISDGIVHAAFTHGFTIFILVAALGHISGGHFNPAVSWAAVLRLKLKWWEFPCYMASQLLGGFCGALLGASILTSDQITATQAGATLLSPTNTWYQGWIAETVVTYFLVHTILLTAMDTDSNVLAPLAIGLTLSIDIFAVGSITGASMNPARSLGPNIVGSIFCQNLVDGFWPNQWIYWAGPFLGATIAAGLHWLFEARDVRLVR